jgi:alkylation response protein AidB-like acyl-CoA dehydrogenase
LADDPTVQSYLTETGGHVNDIAGALSEMGDLFQNPRFGNDEWTLQVAARFVTIQFAHKALSEMQDVPEVMRPMHTKLLEGTTACDRATREATEGLDAFNVAKIEDATESLNKCTEKVQEATALLPTQ